jgi:lactate permease
MFFLSLIPIVIILVLMVRYRWGAARAGAAGYLSALALAVLIFGSGLELLAYAHTKALLLTVDVLMIIWAAFLLYRVADEAGAVRTIGQALPHLTADRGMQALIIGWVFASFLQGVGGFGVPVAVIAPILVGLGFTPLAAVVIPSIGHSWAVTFGSLGSSFQALMAATSLPEETLSPASAALLGAACLGVGPMVAHAAGGWAAARRLVLPGLVIGLVMGVVQYLVVMAGLWNIGAFIASLAGLLVALPLARRFRGEQLPDGDLDGRAVVIALLGYAIVVAITLVAQLIGPLKDALSVITLQVDFPRLQTALRHVTPAGPGRKIVLLGHPGTLLVYSSILSYYLYRQAGLYRPGAAGRILNGTLKSVMSSSVGIASMVAMAAIMQHAGMTDILARGLAEGVGAGFPLVSPWIGALGAFMTGSNTNSNVLFGALQLRTAELLDYGAGLILGAQTAGAALGSVLAPTKVVVGASTAGMQGREGEVMSQLLVYIGVLIAFLSLLALAGAILAA